MNHDVVSKNSDKNQVPNAFKRNTIVERTLEAAKAIQGEDSSDSDANPMEGSVGMVVAVAESLNEIASDNSSETP